jgi:hypothetical protein
MSEEPEWECLSCAAMGCSFFNQLARPLKQKLATAVEALELTIDTLDHFQYSVHDSDDTRFMQARLETARAALEKITKE